jgi:hypothetical protein
MLDIAKPRRKLMRVAPKIAIFSQPRCGLEARAQYSIQMPVGPALEVPTGKPRLLYPALSDHLIN